ncbi:YicC/YloC family endoribonuclease [Robiginitomaculum antarcticum]|uniref:YicC/YloC family endoribonuclease n=1 Tax=Robiginitomaculum antarcticum TaxID=437507 RepID=UPI000376F638|nr:YicC/YloC family endoribonuclease [Robiginitomaculum antarcticum]
MAIRSMTGFARRSGECDGIAWQWELRSVNGRGLDIRLRLPGGSELLESQARKIVASKLSRGNVQGVLSLSRAGAPGDMELDRDLLGGLAAELGYRDPKELQPIVMARLFTVPGVVRPSQIPALTEDDIKLRDTLLAGLKDCVKTLIGAREAEGAALRDDVMAIVDTMRNLTHDAAEQAVSRGLRIKDELLEKFTQLLGENLGEERLAQEAALLAVKADVREEIDRLDAHISQARTHMNDGSPIGRKLDFLAQEFNREINTLCSKSGDLVLTRIGLDLKSANEQFREQVANIE